ncbi:glycoside hydrolase domain-containing protein [Ornithinibacillus xuwenensis]|uniref:Glycoside hydrolase domain-containing protein n=1 Tax=Ornithinibacillus xuwenensis TaxID=3144668 RepID=A0ABU9XFM7_9BACI
MPNEVWGVDSAASVTQALYNCVINNFGKPSYWGRYLTTVPNVSEGLTESEASFIRRNGIRILPIYNDFNSAVGYRNGRVTAANAIFHARRLNYPEGNFVFANTERSFDIDEAWIRGWVDALYPSGYRPGIYADPSTSNFNEAYCAAVANNAEVSNQLVIWSQEPTPGPTRKRDAPAYNPITPRCQANVWGWQYGENAEECPIDTNLFDTRLLEGLW